MEVDWLWNAVNWWLADLDFQSWYLSYPAAVRRLSVWSLFVCFIVRRAWQNVRQSDSSFPAAPSQSLLLMITTEAWHGRSQLSWYGLMSDGTTPQLCVNVFQRLPLCAAESGILIQAVTHDNFNTLKLAAQRTLVFLWHIYRHWINPACHLWNL